MTSPIAIVKHLPLDELHVMETPVYSEQALMRWEAVRANGTTNVIDIVHL